MDNTSKKSELIESSRSGHFYVAKLPIDPFKNCPHVFPGVNCSPSRLGFYLLLYRQSNASPLLTIIQNSQIPTDNDRTLTRPKEAENRPYAPYGSKGLRSGRID